jgi:hypothetical protein
MRILFCRQLLAKVSQTFSPRRDVFFSLCFLLHVFQGQVAKYNYSLRENSTKHSLPRLAGSLHNERSSHRSARSKM